MPNSDKLKLFHPPTLHPIQLFQMQAPDTPTRTLWIPDIAWVEIPGGPFLYGQEKKTLELPTFWIAKYPITNRQYQTFVDAGGYEDERWWEDLIKPEVQDSNWKQSNRPRTDVDWYETVAFCRWLSAMLDLEKNAIRLPTEQEWEKAARGEQGLIYPWGNDYKWGAANINEERGRTGPWNLRQTTAVGMYPHGQSPYSVEDLAGTVLEWCSNKYNPAEVTRPDTSGDERVLRGGSWFDQAVFVRSDIRLRSGPDDRNSYVGFRVLSSAPIR